MPHSNVKSFDLPNRDITPQVVNIPLALYIHMPWCIKKCPYCDFNSYQIPAGGLSATMEATYIDALIADFSAQAKQFADALQQRTISSVFIGGGTPSIISSMGYQYLFKQLKQIIGFTTDCEITLEANPGTLEHQPFNDYLAVGINRLSLGVQTFDNALLKTLGRVHSSTEALQAIRLAKQAGFKRINVDLMHGLPQQTVAGALQDLQYAIDAGATHLSWYQLTIEPNTVFFRTQPQLPDEDLLAEIQSAGEALLVAHGFKQYEVSAWALEQPCQHNLNYWQFGDYLAIGAGAHGKISSINKQGNIAVYRYQKSRVPKDYLAQIPAPNLEYCSIEKDALPFEFMMNALRLKAGVPLDYYTLRTGQSVDTIMPNIKKLEQQQLLTIQPQLACTPLGYSYLNRVLEVFLG